MPFLFCKIHKTLHHLSGVKYLNLKSPPLNPSKSVPQTTTFTYTVSTTVTRAELPS
jgi:hypothetical protein